MILQKLILEHFHIFTALSQTSQREKEGTQEQDDKGVRIKRPVMLRAGWRPLSSFLHGGCKIVEADLQY